MEVYGAGIEVLDVIFGGSRSLLEELRRIWRT